VSADQHFDPTAQLRIASADSIQHKGAVFRLCRYRFQKGSLNLFWIDRHTYLRIGASLEHA
jgi:hypothetical protein